MQPSPSLPAATCARWRAPPTERRARTRAHLLESAADVFARRGFHGASVEEVAEVAGYSKGAVYSNLASKDELFLAVLQDRMRSQIEFLERLTEQAKAEPGGSLVPPDLDWLDLKWYLLAFEFWLHALRNPAVGERLAEVYRHFRAQLAPLLAPFVGEGLEAPELASAAIALYEGLALQRHLDPGAVPVDLSVRVLEGLRTGRDAVPSAHLNRSKG